jgi:hypothetical protein
MSVDECRTALCIQLFKLVWASICGCSHHGGALMCRVGHESGPKVIASAGRNGAQGGYCVYGSALPGPRDCRVADDHGNLQHARKAKPGPTA